MARIAACATDGGTPRALLSRVLPPTFTLQDYFVASRWDRPGTANVVEFRGLIPFEVWNQMNLMRVNIPFRTEADLGPGLSDVRVFDLLLFKTGTGVFGVGPALNLGINRGPGIDSFQVGPALATLFPLSPKVSVGLLSQNFFSAQVAISAVQPILVWNFAPAWTIGLGELPIVYNWKQDSFAVFSIGVQLSTSVDIAGQPVRFFLNPQYNTKSSSELYQWAIASGVTLPVAGTPPEEAAGALPFD